MELPRNSSETHAFSTPEEEIAYLREQVALREQELSVRGAEVVRDDVISDKIKDYSYVAPTQVLHPEFKTSPHAIAELALDLAPEEHDTKISELIGILNEKGVKAALAIIDAMNDPHLEDDFHRFLIQYIKKGYTVPDIKPKSAFFKSLAMTLYEVSLPDSSEADKNKGLKELVSSMEQFYSGMLSIGDKEDGRRYLTLEIANPNHSEEFIIYVAVPDTKKDLFEKQILSLYHYAKIREIPDDYNIFNEAGSTVGSVAELKGHPIFPLKTYEQFDQDPLNVILNTFSKIKKAGEGAAIQIVFRPPGQDYIKLYKHSLDQINKGVSVKKALPKSMGRELYEGFKEVLFSSPKKEGEEKKKPDAINESAVENIKHKISSPIAEINIRLIASAASEGEATRIISDIESSFNQFENAGENKITFKRIKSKYVQGFAKDFSFRAFSEDHLLPLNFAELTTIFHFPGATIGSSPQLKQSLSASAAAPMDMPTEGTLLGINNFRNIETKIYMTKEDRLRHCYVIGQTGTGKSTILKNMIAQDILQGEGVCMIDPHGVDIMDILSIIPPERYEDVIYFDPGYTARPMGLNMLEYDENHPEQKTFVVNELFSIFKKVYGSSPESMGPAFEQYFRNSAMLVMEDPSTGNTLVDISRVLSDKTYRELKLSRCKNPLVKQFWENAVKTTGDQGLANYVQYVTNKFDVFLANDIMRPIVGQEVSSFNFREIMDTKKILLVNLSKGKLGDINANLIGLILVGKILMAALSRGDSLHLNPPPFYLYIDEFQNVTTDSISTILSEARKYKLSLNVAHQFIKQLDEGIRDSVFGNVGNMAIYRVGADDAEFLEKQFAPEFTAKDIMNIENFNAYLKILVRGKPVKPFNIRAMPAPKGEMRNVDKLKELSYLKFGRDRHDVEHDIQEKYKKAPAPAAPVIKPAVATKPSI
jgi:hypothetical protein